MKFKFSLPMPFSVDNIKRLIKINNQIEKSEITNFYFSLPPTSDLFTGFEQPRNYLLEYSKYDFWHTIMSYSLDNGFDIIYNLNLALPVKIENPNLNFQLEKLDNLLNHLKKTGVSKLRLYNIQLLEYIQNYYPNFQIYVSTVTNYSTIQEFRMLKEMYPNVKQVVPSQNINKNFKLLNRIKNNLNLDLEIMCNDGCLKNCINFFNHQGMTDYEQGYFKKITPLNTCFTLENKYPLLYLCQSNHVFPWEIKEYKKIGINNFKLTGRDRFRNERSANICINLFYTYLKGVDNIKEINNFPIIYFLNNSRVTEKLECLKVKDVKKLLPQIKYLKKHGDMCTNDCGINCKYCFDCAKKLTKILVAKESNIKKRKLQICVIKK